MATIKPIDNALGAYTGWSPSAPLQQVIQWSLDARRAVVLGKRIIGGTLIGPGAPDTTRQRDFEEFQKELENKRAGQIEAPDSAIHSFKTTIGAENFYDSIKIVDLDFNGPDQGYRSIELPFVPRELEYNIDSGFAAIRPIARNDAKYHYTGSEDRLEFEIDWHSMDSTREDVIRKCRALEALSKGDAYNNPPHRVMLVWGKENKLFRDHKFLVLSASYRLTQFNKAQINQSTGDVESTYMLPIQAFQRITLGRITEKNLTMQQIYY